MKLWLEGYIDISGDGVLLKSSKKPYCNRKNLSDEIEDKFEEFISVVEKNKGEVNATKTTTLDNVNFRIFVSKEYMSLNECVNNQILMSEGLLEMYYEMFAYSEFTILGLELHSMRLGGHDLYDLFERSKGMYAHILISTEPEIGIDDFLDDSGDNE